jgi:NADH:ubiquinone oxidoreductase subunit 6 (subunit J)
MTSAVITFLLFGMLARLFARSVPGISPAATAPVTEGNLQLVGTLLFTDYLLPFEVVSLLLLVAMIGAIVLGRPRA